MEEILIQIDSIRQELKVLSNIYNALTTFRDKEDVYGLADSVQQLFNERQAEQEEMLVQLVAARQMDVGIPVVDVEEQETA